MWVVIWCCPRHKQVCSMLFTWHRFAKIFAKHRASETGWSYTIPRSLFIKYQILKEGNFYHDMYIDERKLHCKYSEMIGNNSPIMQRRSFFKSVMNSYVKNYKKRFSINEGSCTETDQRIRDVKP